MAQPNPYVVSYNFSAFQASDPTSPLPAPRIDVEFQNIQEAGRVTVNAINDIRRSDGALRNQIVTPESLSPKLNIGFKMRGLWTLGAVYEGGDGVVYGTIFYVALDTNTATNINRPDVDPSTWGYLFSTSDILVAGSLAMPVDTFTGDGGTTIFTLPYDPLSPNNLIVKVGGVVQDVAEYGVSGDTIVFATAPASGFDVEVRGFTTTATLTTVADGAITTPKLGTGAVTDVKVAANAAVASTKLAFTEPAAGGQTRSLFQVVNDFSHSVKYWEPPGGPTVGTGNDDTAVLQAAGLGQRALFLPPGQYNISAPIQLYNGCLFEGAGYQYSRISRIGVWNGPGLQVGDATSGSSGDFTLRRFFIEQVHPGFTSGVNTTIVDRLTNGQALIEVFPSTGGLVEDVWVQYGVYGIRSHGGTRCNFRRIQGLGIYDSLTAGRVETVAIISIPYSSFYGFATEYNIEGCYMGGGNATPVKTITVGSTSFSSHEDAGALYGVQVEACEGLKIRNNYIGGCNGNLVHLEAHNLCTMIDISGNFFDGSTGANISTQSGDGTNIVNTLLIRGNRANGQLLTRNFFRSEANGGGPSLAVAEIVGNIIINHIQTPIVNIGSRGLMVMNNTISGYASRGGGVGDPTISAGMYTSGASAEVRAVGNVYGGGVNDFSSSNNCQWGHYNDSGMSFASGNSALLGVGGGALSAGITQTYPT